MKNEVLRRILITIFVLTPISAILPRPFGDIALIACLIFLALECINNPKLFFKRLATLPIVILSGTTLGIAFYLIIFFSLQELVLFYSSSGLIRVALGAFCILALSTTIVEHEKKTFRILFLKSCLVAAIASGVVGLIQFFGLIPTVQPSVFAFVNGAAIFRSTGWLPHATEYSIVSIVFFGVAAYALTSHFFIWKKFSLLALAFSALGVVTSLSRVAYVSLFLILGLLLCFYIYNRFSWKKTLVIYMIGAITTLATAFYVLYHPPFYILKRVSDVADIQGTHGQRFYENQLGFKLVQTHPFGIGLKNISSVAKPEIEKLVLENQAAWDFFEWRGIHNDYLNTIVIWGVPGLIFYLFLPFFSLKLSSFNEKAYLLGPIIFSLLIYAATNAIYYIESSFFMGFLLYSFKIFQDAPLGSEPRHQTSLKWITWGFIILLIVSLVPDLRLNSILSKRVKAVHIDNPQSTPFNFRMENVDYHIGPWSYSILFTEKNVIHIMTSTGNSLELSLPVRSFDPHFDKYLINVISYPYYKTIHYKYSEVTKKITSSDEPWGSMPAWSIHLFPEIALKSELAFLEGPPLHYQNRVVKKNGEFIPGFPALEVSRENAKPESICWDPTWVYITGTYATIDICSYNKYWSAYGPQVIINYLKYALMLSRDLR